MPAASARRDAEVMNQAIGMNQPARTYQQAPALTGQGTLTPRRDPAAGLAATLIGTAATAASGWTAALTAGVASFLFTGNTDPHVRANAYADAHFSDVYLTSHPLLTVACGLLVAAAMALAFTRRRGLAALLLCAAAAMPWIPAIDFLHHVWQLAPVSTRG
jgi:hypothetical protein